MPRQYRMHARAEAVAETRQRILAAAIRLFSTQPFDLVSLQAVAEESGVGLATVVRQFRSKQRLFVAAAEAGHQQVAAHRGQAPVGDVPAAVRILIDHYEEWGPVMVHLLEQERRVPAIRKVTVRGREYHRAWVEHTFAELLAPLSGAARKVRLATLIAITDLQVWNLLRRELDLSRRQTEQAVLEPLVALGGS